MGNNKLNNDFKNFVSEDNVGGKSEIRVDSTLSESILNFVKRDMDPPALSVFIKMLITHGLVGALTLLFCPQFGYSFTSNDEFYHYLHLTYGVSVCMAICGMIFVGSGALASLFILKEGEVRKIANNRFLYYSATSALMVSLFAFIGAEIYLRMLGFWMVGSVGSGIAISFAGTAFTRYLSYGSNYQN